MLRGLCEHATINRVSKKTHFNDKPIGPCWSCKFQSPFKQNMVIFGYLSKNGTQGFVTLGKTNICPIGNFSWRFVNFGEISMSLKWVFHEKPCYFCVLLGGLYRTFCQRNKKKSRIRETKHLSTDADSSTDTTVSRVDQEYPKTILFF